MTHLCATPSPESVPKGACFHAGGTHLREQLDLLFGVAEFGVAGARKRNAFFEKLERLFKLAIVALELPNNLGKAFERALEFKIGACDAGRFLLTGFFFGHGSLIPFDPVHGQRSEFSNIFSRVFILSISKTMECLSWGFKAFAAWTLRIIACGSIVCYALKASLAQENFSSRNNPACLGSGPVRTIDFTPTRSYSGRLDPIWLPRNADRPDQPTNVVLNLSWTDLSEILTAVRAEVFYDAQLSLEYPIFKIRFTLWDGTDLIGEKSFDFTNECQNPRGNPLFAGDRFTAGKFETALAGLKSPRVRVELWGGLF